MQFTRSFLLLSIRCSAMPLPPRQNVNVRFLSHACLLPSNLFNKGLRVTDFCNYILLISPLSSCALPMRVFLQYISPLSIRVPFVWGYRVCIFFTPFDSWTLFERVPRMHIMNMPCLCRFDDHEVNPLDSQTNANAHANGCSLAILKFINMFIAFKKYNEQ